MKSTVNILVKWGNDLEQNEIDEMSRIIQFYDPGLPQNHLYLAHIKKNNPLFIIAYKADRIISFQSHSIFYSTSPFFKNPTPIILGGTAYQLKEASKYGLAIKMANIFMSYCFGRFWFLKKIVIIADTVNPKSLRGIYKIFGDSYPDMHKPIPTKVLTFAKNLMQQYYGQHVDVDNNLVMSNAHPYQGLSNISPFWDKMYKTRSDFDQYYLDHSVVIKLGKDYFIGGDSIVSVSYYSPLKLLKKLLSQLFKLILHKKEEKKKTYWWRSSKNWKEKQIA